MFRAEAEGHAAIGEMDTIAMCKACSMHASAGATGARQGRASSNHFEWTPFACSVHCVGNMAVDCEQVLIMI
jgi:hypothetical protein